MSDFDREVERIWSEYQRSSGRRFEQSTRDRINRLVFDGDDKHTDGDPELSESLLESLQKHLEVALLTSASPQRMEECDSASAGTIATEASAKRVERWMHLFLYVSHRLEMVDGRVRRRSWIHVAEDWNRDHPYDRFSPTTLAREWNRAKANPAVSGTVRILRQAFEDCGAPFPDAWKAIDEAQSPTRSVSTQWITGFLREMKLEHRYGGQESQP